MNTYLTIITTILVLTQIIRVTQNYITLKNHKYVDEKNKHVYEIYKKIECIIDEELNK